ncbi:cation diffusion facilitator family transporter [Kallotenue papyrolyticum]|uniref:cation diffusion facilitator family transporter n=1 Tax=Kallotenue papyrolyticum TaxID=1325125 RepID=UPI000478645C|nr:cation diffusion facilitator family transporter [Kallotenue papyrolyticum]
MVINSKHQASPRRYALLSVGAALLTITLKFTAYLITGSVGLFSDAAESLVNLLAALIALWALTLAAQPPDEEHAYGHTKAEYFASGLEGALILLAAAGIGYAAWQRLQVPQPLERIGVGIIISLLAAALNGAVALILLRAGRRLNSIALRADAHHLLTDVWTTLGVVVGVGLVQATGWLWLDPLIAVLVAINILWIGVRLLRETGYGLLDTALPEAERRAIQALLSRYEAQGIGFHAVRTRQSGTRRFVSLHVLVPGSWTVQRGHDLCETIEHEIRQTLGEASVFTHLEPMEDPVAWADQGLDRQPTAQQPAARQS